MPPAVPDSSVPVLVGWVIGVHGTSGQVRVRTYSDAPHRFDPGQTLHCNGVALKIASATPTRPNQLLLQFESINSPNAARPLVGQWLTVPPGNSANLPDGEYFHYQLLGLKVVTDENEELGQITEVIETGSNDVYLVTGPQGQVLIPAITSVVQEVNLEQGVMLVRLLEGLR